MGPQHGEPLCPCQMRHLKVENGRWITPDGKDLGEYFFVNKTRVEDLKDEDACQAMGHNPHPDNVPPMGKVFIHVCDACGDSFRLMPNFFKAFMEKDLVKGLTKS